MQEWAYEQSQDKGKEDNASVCELSSTMIFRLSPCLNICLSLSHDLAVSIRVDSRPGTFLAMLGVSWRCALIGQKAFSLALLRLGIVFSSATFFFDL